MANFVDASAVEQVEGAFTTNLDPEWTVGGRPHGGYLLAVLARAAVQTTPNHPHVLSASAVYVSSPDVGPATVMVEPLRQGRTASQVRASLVQKDRTCVETLFTVGRLDPGAAQRWVDAPPPAVASFEECHRGKISPQRSDVVIGMAGMVDQRIDPASYRPGARADGSGELLGWLSFADGAPFDAVSLLYVSDAFPPATFTIGSVGWVPTLELTAYIRALPAPGPLRIRQRVRMQAGGFADQVFEAWDSEDRVIVQASQLTAVRMGNSG